MELVLLTRYEEVASKSRVENCPVDVLSSDCSVLAVEGPYIGPRAGMVAGIPPNGAELRTLCCGGGGPIKKNCKN